MCFIPKKNGKAAYLLLLFIITGVVLFALSGMFPYAWLFQLAAVALSVAGIQLLVRFVLSDFKYVIHDLDDGSSDFIVYKTQGKNKVKVCHISLSYAEEIYSGKSKRSADRRYNYVQNIGVEATNIIFLDGDLKTEINIEADAAFTDAVKVRMGNGDGNTAFAM